MFFFKGKDGFKHYVVGRIPKKEADVVFWGPQHFLDDLRVSENKLAHPVGSDLGPVRQIRLVRRSRFMGRRFTQSRRKMRKLDSDMRAMRSPTGRR